MKIINLHTAQAWVSKARAPDNLIPSNFYQREHVPVYYI